jgi:hypothetical protein
MLDNSNHRKTKKNTEHAVVHASQPVYLQIVCLGTAGIGLFCFLSAIPPSHFTCNAIPTVGAVSFSLIVTPLAVKTQLVLAVFSNSAMRAVKAKKGRRIALIFAVAGTELLICILLSATVPFMPTVVLLPTDLDPVSGVVTYECVYAPVKMHMYVCVYMYMYVYAYVYVFVSACVCTCARTCTRAVWVV